MIVWQMDIYIVHKDNKNSGPFESKGNYVVKNEFHAAIKREYHWHQC